MSKTILSCLAVFAIAGATVIAGEIDLEDVKCVVAPRAAKASQSADYKKGKVYFCCGNCAGSFAKDTKKFAEKANHQLVSTKQYEQKKCPMSGSDLNPETAIKVAGQKVAFCCDGCKGTVEKADEKKQMQLVFANKPFDKAFAKVEKKAE